MKIVSTICFISLYYLDDGVYFTVFALIARAFQGISIEFISILIFSLSIIISEPEDQHKNLGFAEMSISAGKILGPLIALSLYKFGYPIPFAITLLFDVIVYMLLFFAMTLKRSELNRMSDNEDSDENKIKTLSFVRYLRENILLKSHLKSNRHNSYNEVRPRMLTENSISNFSPILNHTHIANMEDDNTSVKSEEDSVLMKMETKMNDQGSASFFLALIFNKKIILTFIIAIADFLCQTFFLPVYTQVMKTNYNLSVEESSIYLSSFYFVYFVGLRMIIVLTEKFPAKFLLCVGTLLNSFAVVFLNPSNIFPQTLPFVLFGYLFLHTFGGIIILNSIIDMTQSLKKLGLNEYVANDNASAIYILAINFSELIGPLIGGIVTGYYNFEFACNIVGSINLFLSILFLILHHKKIIRSLLFMKGGNMIE